MFSSPPIAAVSPGRSAQQTPPTPIGESESTLGKFTFPPPRNTSAPSTPVSPTEFPSHKKPASFPAPQALGSPEKLPNRLRGLKIDAGAVNPVAQIDLKSPVDEPDYENISRVISAQSVSGETPRNSGEFYSMSNSTTETLLSEYDPRASARVTRLPHHRRHSLLSIGPNYTECLMMGYAQVIGTFTLDGSLIQTSIFEEAKRKGVVGTHSGGGVVGVETSKHDGGFLSGFGWNLGGGLGGLLGGGGMSSIAEMKNAASKSALPWHSFPISHSLKATEPSQSFQHHSPYSLLISVSLPARADLICTSLRSPPGSRRRTVERR